MSPLRNAAKTLGSVACAIIGGIAGLVIGLVLSMIFFYNGSPGWLSIACIALTCMSGAIICMIYTPAAEIAMEIISGVVNFIATVLKAIIELLSGF